MEVDKKRNRAPKKGNFVGRVGLARGWEKCESHHKGKYGRVQTRIC